ncbi:MAG: hypothetical protein LBG69_00635 [Zoogloeaceae bacterium]|jgi:hypothetical protein|nr:hypothetical protein [Zoogloeaceae bacterium]
MRDVVSVYGFSVKPYTVPEPPSPFLMEDEDGALEPGDYLVAVSWMRKGMESSLSPSEKITLRSAAGIRAALPMVMDDTIDFVRIYMTRRNGGEMLLQETVPASVSETAIRMDNAGGKPSPFRGFSPMCGGERAGLSLWRGRLVVSSGGTMTFSEPLAYHLRDPRHGFFLFPETVTFIAPVAGGLFVGQETHVVFLSGDRPENLAMNPLACQAPIAGSAVLLEGKDSGADSSVALWCADNGHVMGMPDGSVKELQADRIFGITPKILSSAIEGYSLAKDGRATTFLAG